MEQKLGRQFLEDRTAVIDIIPFSWNVKAKGPHYCLNMKMSRLRELAFDFASDAVQPGREWSATGSPERVLKLNVSVNELEELRDEGLSPFVNLCELDAALNSISNLQGLGALPNLLVLNLSYNAIANVQGLGQCKTLTLLNLSHNRIWTISNMPALSSLTQIHLESNKLRSLEGIQNLPQLCELYVQNNQLSSLLPLATSLSLRTLDASSNDITSLRESLQILRGLSRLRRLKLRGNPLARDNRYTTMIREATSVEILDNSLLEASHTSGELPWPRNRPALRDSYLLSSGLSLPAPARGQTKEGLKDTVREAFQEKLQAKEKDMESTVHYLHSRILDLQEELREYEEDMRVEMEGCLRYIDSTPSEDFQSIDPQKALKAMDRHLFTKFWLRWEHGKRKRRIPFKELTEPEEVVRTAAQLLSDLEPSTSLHSS
ncbi:centriolin-like isoform X1 [Latimeria chalumnae]|uniref:centriolin-like isoform X1 n=1 Tax=Latimeria chalumnae TaxID=7897 RepID=UPI00313DA55A